MASHSREEFTETEQQITAIAKALGHPARVAILRLLAQRQSCVNGELVLELPISQSTVSQHLKELNAAGLVQQGRVDGPRVCYRLDPAGWARARPLLGNLLTQVLVTAGLLLSGIGAVVVDKQTHTLGHGGVAAELA